MRVGAIIRSSFEGRYLFSWQITTLMIAMWKFVFPDFKDTFIFFSYYDGTNDNDNS